MIVPGKNERDLAKYSQAIDDLAQGRTNAIADGAFTLANGVSRTRVDDKRSGADALPRWVPVTESAARAVVWLVETGRGYFIVGHDLNAATNRTFRYELRNR